jgi:uncharacterized protein (UPF0548 family)
VFVLKEPTVADIRNFLTFQSRKNFCYKERGMTRSGEIPDDYIIDHHRIKLGTGDETWQRARRALTSWRMFNTDFTRVCWPYKRIEQGVIVGVLALHYGFWSVNATRIVYVVDEAETPKKRFGFAYGTLGDHALAGEERFLVERLEDGTVWYDIQTASRPRQWAARYGYPWVRRLQKRFGRDSLKAMVHAVRVPVTPPPVPPEDDES